MPEAVTLREHLRARAVLGTFVQTPHPVTAEFLSGFGLDFLCIDAEHAAMGVETVQALVAAAAPVAALVRVAENGAAHVGAALDSGAAGVLVPRVSSGAEAAAAVRFARYPPLGERGAGPGRAGGYGRSLDEYLGRANEQLVVAVQVETRAALDRLDEILAVAGVDVVFFGPGDLALSLGVPLGGEKVYEAVESGFARALAAGRTVGAHANGAVDAAHWLARGARLLTLGSDLTFLAAGLVEARGRLEELTA